MARKMRFYRLNNCHHVMLRGNAGENIFFDDADRCRFCLLLQAASEKHAFYVHAFCFMSNHIHLVLEPTEQPLQKGVHAFSFRYAQYLNRRYKRKGYVYQGRFRSICVEDGLYFKRLVRYIHLNPVHSGLAQNPFDYRWCSHRAYVGMTDYVWLKKERVLSAFGKTIEQALHEFQSYMNSQIDIEEESATIVKAFAVGAFGSDDLLDQAIKQNVLSLSERSSSLNCSIELAIDSVCIRCNITQSELTSPSRKKELVEARAVLAFIAQKAANWNFEDLALVLGRDASSISRLAAKANSRTDLRHLANSLNLTSEQAV